MTLFFNGRFVPEAKAVVSVLDRSFLYGDGLFETLRVSQGKPFRWSQHMERWQRGADFLKLRLPYRPAELRAAAEQLIRQNQLLEGVLRVTTSRGVGPRGYSMRGAVHPTVVMSLHAAPRVDPAQPPTWRLQTSALRVNPADPLTAFKTANKLPAILARAEAEAAGADEALLLNLDGHLAEASSANLFWIEGEVICTPPLSAGILPGITRAAVMERCGQMGLAVREITRKLDALASAQGVFLTLSAWGVVEATTLDGKPLSRSSLVAKISEAHWNLLKGETSQ